MHIKNKGLKITTLILTNFELLQVFVRYNVFTKNNQSKSVLSFYKSILLFIFFATLAAAIRIETEKSAGGKKC